MILLQQNFYFHPLIGVESFLNAYIYKMENRVVLMLSVISV